jgi:hypothetical protein
MTRIKALGVCAIAVLAIGASATSVASAAPSLTLRTAKGPLKAGAEIQASSSDLVFETGFGNAECTSNTFAGTLSNNGASIDEGSIAAESSTGEEGEGLCKSSSALGPYSWMGSNPPWPFKIRSNGKLELDKPPAAGEKIAFTQIFPDAGGLTCVWETSKITATFRDGKAGETIPINLQMNALLKLNKKVSGSSCPASGKWRGDLVLSSGGETIFGELA